jgi:hypothetical protein
MSGISSSNKVDQPSSSMRFQEVNRNTLIAKQLKKNDSEGNSFSKSINGSIPPITTLTKEESPSKLIEAKQAIVTNHFKEIVDALESPSIQNIENSILRIQRLISESEEINIQIVAKFAIKLVELFGHENESIRHNALNTINDLTKKTNLVKSELLNSTSEQLNQQMAHGNGFVKVSALKIVMCLGQGNDDVQKKIVETFGETVLQLFYDDNEYIKGISKATIFHLTVSTDDVKMSIVNILGDKLLQFLYEKGESVRGVVNKILNELQNTKSKDCNDSLISFFSTMFIALSTSKVENKNMATHLILNLAGKSERNKDRIITFFENPENSIKNEIACKIIVGVLESKKS